MRPSSKKFVQQNLIVGAVAALTVAAVYVLAGQSAEVWGTDQRKAAGALWRLNVATASTALIGLVVTLFIGPLRQARGRVNPLHIPIRRIIGVWTTAVALAHVVGGLSIHADGWRIWGPFLRIVPGYGRLVDPFGVGFWLGLAALGILLVLAVTSNNAALRKLGARRWKAVHRFSYLLMLLVGLHSLSLQIGERRDLVHVIVTQSIVGIGVAGLGLRFYWSLRSRRE